ncbi:MAG: hypothetical protein HND58_04590 [Planctomycetota bacterium]|nr:MAG: hypothetical protein HND58_04590 [Planctomycetota bacterium]
MSPRPPRRLPLGTATSIGAAVLAFTAITVAGLGSFGAFSGLTSARLAMLAAPEAVEVEATLARVGITAETLAAAGCSSGDATNVGADALAHLDTTNWNALVSADGDVRDAQAEVDRLGKLVRAGQADQEDLTAYATAKSTLATETSTRDGLLDALYDAAVADLTSGETTLLETMHGNSDRPVPLQYTVSDRTDAQWTSLRNALANIKTSGMCGEDPDTACTTLVTNCNAETEVATAASNLDSNLAGVTSALHTALGQE